MNKAYISSEEIQGDAYSHSVKRACGNAKHGIALMPRSYQESEGNGTFLWIARIFRNIRINIKRIIKSTAGL